VTAGRCSPATGVSCLRPSGRLVAHCCRHALSSRRAGRLGDRLRQPRVCWLAVDDAAGCREADGAAHNRHLVRLGCRSAPWRSVAKAVVSLLFDYGDQVAVTPFFNLVHFRNNGAAFSLLAGAGGWARFGFAALALGISLWLIRLLRQGVSKWEGVGYCLILGGALGNAVDRLLRGAVVDFLDFHWQGAHWPAFNLADVAISLGAVCLLAAAVHQGKLAAQDPGYQ